MEDNEAGYIDEIMQLTGIDTVTRDWILTGKGENKYAHDMEIPGKIHSHVRLWTQLRVQSSTTNMLDRLTSVPGYMLIGIMR